MTKPIARTMLIAMCVDCNVHIVTVEESALSVFNELPQTDHLNFTIFLRLLLPDPLPQDTEKVIYLDSDLLFAESDQEIGTRT